MRLSEVFRCAVSCTGHGESIMRVTLARHLLACLQQGESGADAASARALGDMHARLGGCGGTICVAPGGDVGIAFSTPRMAWACIQDGGGVRSGIDRSQRGAEGVVEVVELD